MRQAVIIFSCSGERDKVSKLGAIPKVPVTVVGGEPVGEGITQLFQGGREQWIAYGINSLSNVLFGFNNDPSVSEIRVSPPSTDVPFVEFRPFDVRAFAKIAFEAIELKLSELMLSELKVRALSEIELNVKELKLKALSVREFKVIASSISFALQMHSRQTAFFRLQWHQC